MEQLTRGYLERYLDGLEAIGAEIEASDTVPVVRETEKWGAPPTFETTYPPFWAVASHLSDYGTFKSHARRVDRDELRSLDLNVTNLEDDQVFQDLVLSVHHAVNHTMGAVGLVKIVENNEGKAFLRRVQRMAVPVQVEQPVAGPGGLRPAARAKPAKPKQPRPQRKRR